MERKVVITVGDRQEKAELNDSRVAQAIWEKLPISAQVSTWGEEIYFEIPVKTKIDRPVREVAKGDLCYWPNGACFCIFFGPTPMSSGDKIIPASEVEIIGKLVTTDYAGLKTARDGQPVRIERAERGKSG